MMRIFIRLFVKLLITVTKKYVLGPKAVRYHKYYGQKTPPKVKIIPKSSDVILRKIPPGSYLKKLYLGFNSRQKKSIKALYHRYKINCRKVGIKIEFDFIQEVIRDVEKYKIFKK